MLEIIIDELVSRDSIILNKYNNIILIENFNISKSTISYKLIKSDIYNLLLEQLNMKDTLVAYIINKLNNNIYSFVISNINIYNSIIYIIQKNKYLYDITYYGINLDNIPITIKD